MEPYKISIHSDRAKPYNRSILTQGASSLFYLDRIEWIFPTTEEMKQKKDRVGTRTLLLYEVYPMLDAEAHI
ncbi:unnamed protein product [Musa acuminata subsp. malaccensis]|uniref:Uncharacterized protein n=1 Tax=Musa acuminata subsp. malaccensis TaxID=214687 RepID=A0A804U5P5_MUSAM|nr:unnamed protein product [Musa acuminata subsp. malaccensis]